MTTLPTLVTQTGRTVLMTAVLEPIRADRRGRWLAVLLVTAGLAAFGATVLAWRRGLPAKISDDSGPVLSIRRVPGRSLGRGGAPEVPARSDGVRLAFDHPAGALSVVSFALPEGAAAPVRLWLDDQPMEVGRALPPGPRGSVAIRLPLASDAGGSHLLRVDAGHDGADFRVDWLLVESHVPSALDVARAVSLEQRGELLRSQRSVVAGNLFAAWRALALARRLRLGEPAAEAVEVASQSLVSVEAALHDLCRRQLFQAGQAFHFGRPEAARAALLTLLGEFPEPVHPCRHRAVSALEE